MINNLRKMVIAVALITVSAITTSAQADTYPEPVTTGPCKIRVPMVMVQVVPNTGSYVGVAISQGLIDKDGKIVNIAAPGKPVSNITATYAHSFKEKFMGVKGANYQQNRVITLAIAELKKKLAAYPRVQQCSSITYTDTTFVYADGSRDSGWSIP